MAAETLIKKATRLVQTGAVEEIKDARTFKVQGDNGIHTVVARGGLEATCSCPAGENLDGHCSHALAALKIAADT